MLINLTLFFFFFQGLLVACGSSKGTVYLAELSENLGTADKNDKQLLTHVRNTKQGFHKYISQN